MQILPDGTYRLKDGRVLTAEEMTRLHQDAPLAEGATKKQEDEDKLDLQEGQSSGKIELLD